MHVCVCVCAREGVCVCVSGHASVCVCISVSLFVSLPRAARDANKYVCPPCGTQVLGSVSTDHLTKKPLSVVHARLIH